MSRGPRGDEARAIIARGRDGRTPNHRGDADVLQRVRRRPTGPSWPRRLRSGNLEQELESTSSIGDDGVTVLVCVDGSPAGTVGLEPPDAVRGSGKIGHPIAPDRWTDGDATDAVDGRCAYAFEERRLAEVYSVVSASNPASGRVPENVGCREEGRLREEADVDGEHVDVIRCGLLARDR